MNGADLLLRGAADSQPPGVSGLSTLLAPQPPSPPRLKIKQVRRRDDGGNSGGIRPRSPVVAGDRSGRLACWDTLDDRR